MTQGSTFGRCEFLEGIRISQGHLGTQSNSPRGFQGTKYFYSQGKGSRRGKQYNEQSSSLGCMSPNTQERWRWGGKTWFHSSRSVIRGSFAPGPWWGRTSQLWENVTRKQLRQRSWGQGTASKDTQWTTYHGPYLLKFLGCSQIAPLSGLQPFSAWAQCTAFTWNRASSRGQLTRSSPEKRKGESSRRSKTSLILPVLITGKIQITQLLIIHILIVSRFRNKRHNDIKLLCVRFHPLSITALSPTSGSPFWTSLLSNEWGYGKHLAEQRKLFQSPVPDLPKTQWHGTEDRWSWRTAQTPANCWWSGGVEAPGHSGKNKKLK